MTIARDLGIDCRVDNIARSDLYIAEEIFVCGTAAEISSVNSVDDRVDPVPRPEDHGHRRGLRPRRPRRGAAVQGLVRARRLSAESASSRAPGPAMPRRSGASAAGIRQTLGRATVDARDSVATEAEKRTAPGALRPEPLRCPGQLKVGRTIHRWSTCWR